MKPQYTEQCSLWRTPSACLLATALALCAAVDARAQDAQAAASPANDPTTDESGRVVITAIPLEEQYLPTARPVSSVYGNDLNVLDIPRSVSLINATQLKDRGVANVTDLGQFSASVYTPSRYGLASVPVIRGDLGEVFQNNMRLRYNRNGYPVSFNGVESVDLVKGPGPVVYGPGSQVGGYVNFLTKQPYFDAWHGEVSNLLGRYVPGGQSYLRDEYNIDIGGPLTQQLAIRVSYLGRESDSYYRYVEDNTQDIFGALSWIPNETLKVDLNAQYYTARYNEVIGTNRPTQDLIDNDQYITGPTSSFGSGQPGFLGIVTPTGTTKVRGYKTLIAPDDGATATVFLGNLAITKTLSENVTLTNRSFFESADHTKRSAYRYNEYVPESYTLENRTELNVKFDFVLGGLTVKNDVVTGFDFRWERTKGYTEFLNEFINGYDLTKDPSTFRAPLGALFGAVPIEGTAYLGNPTSLNNSTGKSDLFDYGLFYQHRFEFGDKWALTAGGRADVLDARASSLLDDPSYSDRASVVNPSYNASLSYKPVEKLTVYGTYNHTTAYQGIYDSGGIPFTQDGGIARQTLQVKSDLAELGVKYEVIPTQLYGSAAGFYQRRETLDRFNNPNEIQVYGGEAELIWQPTTSFNVSTNITYEKGNYIDLGGGVASTRNPGDFLTVGSPNFNAYEKGNYDIPGLPDVLFNIYATYTMKCGLGVGIGTQVQGEQNANLDGTLKIPAQFSCNATVFYRTKRWETSITVYNFTDERNYTSVDPSFGGNDLILQDQPLSVEWRVGIKF